MSVSAVHMDSAEAVVSMGSLEAVGLAECMDLPVAAGLAECMDLPVAAEAQQLQLLFVVQQPFLPEQLALNFVQKLLALLGLHFVQV